VRKIRASSARKIRFTATRWLALGSLAEPRYAERFVLPIVAVQIAPGAAAPALAEQLIFACNAGLERARCVTAGELPARSVDGEKPRGIAMVSWDGAGRVSIEVGLANGDAPVWVSRQLEFADADPEAERWRAVGLTIALMADDPRFWVMPPQPAPLLGQAPSDTARPSGNDAIAHAGSGIVAELRGLTGAGIVAGPWRWGAELRLTVPLASVFFVTGSANYALATDSALDVRWFDATLGLAVAAGSVFAGLEARLRLELLGENVAVTVQRDAASARANAWVPGVSVGADLLWALDERWLLSTRADAFWLDGSTAIVSAGRRLGAAAGAGVLCGLGAGRRF
jgi:hypothetical protein